MINLRLSGLLRAPFSRVLLSAGLLAIIGGLTMDAQAGDAQTSSRLLAYEPFDSPTGTLDGVNSGAGWGTPWDIQNQSTNIPGFIVDNSAPIVYEGLPQTGNYASGGYQFISAGRHFDTNANGSFSGFVSNGLIGQPGQTIWVSLLMSKAGSSHDSFYVAFHSGSTDYWESTPGVEAGYFGSASESSGNRYWGVRLDNVVYSSNDLLVLGQPALLVLRIDFGATSTVSLYVNPDLTSVPGTPDAQATTSDSLAFKSLLYASGWASGDTAIDEIRVATDYNSAVGASSVVPDSPTGVTTTSTDTQTLVSWNAVPGATSYQIFRSVDDTDFDLLAGSTGTSYTDTDVVPGAVYEYYVVAQNVAGQSFSSAEATGFPRSVLQPQAGLGQNLAKLCDWSRSWPFVDIFKMARPWISQQTGSAWGKGGPLNLTPDGWIASLQPGHYAETIIFDNALDDGKADFPTGNYALFYDGEGTIAFDLGSATIVSQSPGQMIVNVPAGRIGIFLEVTETNPDNPLRNIRFVMPGFESSYQEQPFHPAFLSELQGIRSVRFMEWSLTNNSTVQSWTDRALPTDYTYSWRGASLETMIQLANTLGTAPWFNMPHQASDDYIRQFASTVYRQLNPTLKVYIEYSNETWNSQFSQNAYVRNMGVTMGLNPDPNMAGADYTALRSVQIFQIWQQVFGGTERLVRVLPSQAANAARSQEIVSFHNAYGYADALAIAAYYSVCSDAATGGWGFLGDPATANQVSVLSVDQILDIELNHIRNCALTEITSNAAVAQQYGLKMVAYEGGQHLVGVGRAQNNRQLISLFKAANRSPRIQDLYNEYLQNWKAVGGDLFVNYSDVGAYTQYGSFGALEYQDQDPSTAPKFRALMQFASDNQ